MASIKGTAAKAGSTTHTRFTSRKPSRGCNSRRCLVVSSRISTPTPSVSARHLSQISRRATSSSAQAQARGTKNMKEKPTITRASTLSTGAKEVMANQKKVALTWNSFSTARSCRLLGTKMMTWSPS